MPRLTVAGDEQVEQIYTESHALWGGGLSLHEYRRFWAELSTTPWARKNVSYQVWLDAAGDVLSSAKLYRPRIQLGGEVARASILGAVFTPRAHRRAGHARSMIEAILDEARSHGDRLALLFSDIGTRYYARLGFAALPAAEVWGRLARSLRMPDGWQLDPMRAEHLPLVHKAHEAWCRSRSIAILRDLEHWQFLFVRTAGFFKRLDDSRLTHRAMVAHDNGRFAGYLIWVEGHGEWSIREVGAAAGDPGTMATVIRAGAAHARRQGMRKLYGWLPDSVLDGLDDWTLRRTARRRAQPMILGLGDSLNLSRLSTPEDAFFPYQDQF